MRKLLLLTFVMSLIACSHAKVKPTTIQAGCLREPPPVTEALEFSDCPDDLAICLNLDQARQLVKDMWRMKNWEDEAWRRCGPLEK